MREIGKKGEDFAEKLLKKNNYKIIERNFTIRGGEIDIIAKDKETLVFVEVKLRKNSDYGRPSEFVTPYKQEKLIYTAKNYLAKTGSENVMCRFDVVELIGDMGKDGKLKIKEANIIKNAFMC